MPLSSAPVSAAHSAPRFAVQEELRRFWAAFGAKGSEDKVVLKSASAAQASSKDDEEPSSPTKSASSESARPARRLRRPALEPRKKSLSKRRKTRCDKKRSSRRGRTRTRTRSSSMDRLGVAGRPDHTRKSDWVRVSRRLASVVADSMVASRSAMEFEDEDNKGVTLREATACSGRSSPRSSSSTPSSSPFSRRRKSNRQRSRSPAAGGASEQKRLLACSDAAGGRPAPASPKKQRVRESKWDQLCSTEEALNLYKLPPSGSAKKHRECYIGNLAMGQVTEQSLRDIFKNMFEAIPEYRYTYPDVGDPILSMLFPPGGHGCFCFVEFIDQVLAATAIQMSGLEVMGRPMRVGRPQGYVGMATGEEPPPLCVQALRDAGVLPHRPPETVSMASHPTGANTRLRQLYVGNLVVGQVAEKDIIELFTPVCEQLPEYNPQQGPAITRVHWSSTGMYCFVDFQSPQIADQILIAFDSAQLCGRPMKLGRPSGYDYAASQTTSPGVPTTITPAVVASSAFQAGAAAAKSLSTL